LPCNGSSGRKAGPRPKQVAVVATRMVTDMIGEGASGEAECGEGVQRAAQVSSAGGSACLS
jgi:hypothetical protein